MKKRRIIIALLALVILTAVFFFGEKAAAPSDDFSDFGNNLPISENADNADDYIGETNIPAGEMPKTQDADESTNRSAENERNTVSDETESTPSGIGEKASPSASEATDGGDEYLSCTLSISCAAVLNNMDMLDKEKHTLIPPDGILYAERKVVFYEGESVFNVLLRETRQNKIHMEYENTPIYNSAYIEGIGNLYEFDCGELSGWMYKVNGNFPNYGCSQYKLKQGDRIEWVYTCDLGKDVGGGNAARNGR